MQYCSIEVYITRFCWAMSPRARVAASYPTFNQHTFRPWEIYPFGLKFLISKLGQQAEILALWYTFPSTTRKMAYGQPQHLTRTEKISFIWCWLWRMLLQAETGYLPGYFCSTWESVDFMVFWILKVGNESFRVRW